MAVGKNEEASRSYHKAAQFTEQLIEMLEESDARRAWSVRATEYKQRARTLISKGGMDTKRVKPVEDHEADDVAYSDEEADALDGLHFVDRCHQVAQTPSPRQVVAVGVHVLAKEGDLPDASISEKPDLADDIRYGPADLPAAAVRDYAE